METSNGSEIAAHQRSMRPGETIMQTILGALRRLGETIALSLCKLNEIQFSAPWNPARTRCGASGL
jgi:hypothetical protein